MLGYYPNRCNIVMLGYYPIRWNTVMLGYYPIRWNTGMLGYYPIRGEYCHVGLLSDSGGILSCWVIVCKQLYKKNLCIAANINFHYEMDSG